MLLPVKHPGPIAHGRLDIAVAKGIRKRVELQPGQSISVALDTAVSEICGSVGEDCPSDSCGSFATAGFAEFVSGTAESVSYCYPASGGPAQPLSYSETRHDRLVEVISGSAVIGERPGTPIEPWSHIHMLWQDRAGVIRAGHIWPDTRVGSSGILAHVTRLLGIRLNNGPDPETHLPVFAPEVTAVQGPALTPPDGTQALDVAFTRVRPNVELAWAITGVCSRLGWSEATIRAGTGSIVGATLVDAFSGDETEVPGPATEVVTLRGQISGGRLSGLSATLVDARGAVHAGALAHRGNLVGATYDLILERGTD